MKTQLLIKTDKKLKTQAQKLAKDIGVPLSSIMNSFLKRFIADKEVTFSVKKYRMTPYLEKIIKEAKEEYEQGDYQGPFKNAKDMIKSLKS